ncbi:MAG: nicotinate (nicotinamide) nucleotide adenylyltransferase [Ignavibacteria bacterium GWB2_35_6b]|nr:MAG: nicotinate (nicotinamide) nucleotide adenylyltransferase [Ignavibacteria bacterium GWB2_35_6b]
MSKVGVYGGTFDPIHTGHLITAQHILEERRLDKIIFIPSYISPHKTQLLSTESKHRLEMVKIAIEGYKKFDLSDYEIQKGGVSYTVDTLKELKSSYKEIELIIGYDNLLSFDVWHEPDQIIKLAKLLVLKRKFAGDINQFNKYFAEAVFIDSPVIDISSTQIRDRVRKNLPVDFLVPQKVKEYITSNSLYK